MTMSHAAIEARRQLKIYLEDNNLTETDLSKAVGVNQSTVQRFMKGRTKTITKTVRLLLKHAKIDEQKCINTSRKNVLKNEHIRLVLDTMLSSDEASAQMLAKLIVAIAPLIRQSQASTTHQ